MKKIIPLLLILMLVSCKPTDEERAREYITRGEQLIANDEWNNALNTLDSVDILFPKLVSLRRGIPVIINVLVFVGHKAGFEIFFENILAFDLFETAFRV